MGTAEDSKRVMDRKNKKIHFTSEIKHIVRSYDKNAENSIFRTHDVNTSILGARYNAGTNCRSK